MKKIIVYILAICMMLPLGAFAEDDKGLSQAITFAKSVIDVPAEFTVFEYSSSEEDGVTYWNLNWSDKERKQGQISVSLDQNGNFSSYYKYLYRPGEQTPELAVVTEAQAKETAAQFILKALPTIGTKMQPTENLNRYYYASDTFSYAYMQYENGYPVINNTCTVQVDKFTGEVQNMNCFRIKPVTYTPADKTISEDEATKNYLEQIGVTLSYSSRYDYQKDELTVFPMYAPNTYLNKAISAVDGSVIELGTPDNNYPMDDMMSEKAMNSMGGGGYTKEEQAAIDKVSGLMSKEQAVAKLKSAVTAMPKDVVVESSSLMQNRVDKDKYFWNLTLKKDDQYIGSGSVDAKTGELIEFNLYSEDKTNAKAITRAQAQAKVEEFLKKTSPEKFKQTKLTEVPPQIQPLRKIAATAAQTEEKQEDSYYFSYVRQVNDISFDSNGLYITYDNLSGEITAFRNTWYDSAVFPSVEKVMSAAEIMEKMKQAAGFEIMYNEEKLVYDFINKSMLRFDPFTGTQLNYDGKPYEKITPPVYEDIAGHWSEKIVQTLLENGIYKNTNQFKPDENITQIDFFRFVLQWMTSGSDDDDVYESLINQGYLTKEEKNPTAGVTRQEAVKVFAKILGCDEVAKYSEIFVYPFKDELAQEYKGYATICNAFGIVSGDAEGNFNGGKYITNAETAAMIYNMKNRVKK